MSTVTHDIVAKLWNLCNVLKDDGVTYHQYVTELTYEGLLQKNTSEKKSGAGQNFTPRPLIDAMVAVTRPTLEDLIQDPAAGTDVVLPDNVLFEGNIGRTIRADIMDKCNLHTHPRGDRRAQ